MGTEVCKLVDPHLCGCGAQAREGMRARGRGELGERRSACE